MWSFHTENSAKAEATITINRGIDRVFTFVATEFVRNYPRWSPEVDQVTAVSEGPMRVDYRIRQRRADRTDDVESVLRITMFEPPSAFSYESLSDPYHGHYFFSGLPQLKGTTMTFEFQLDDIELVMRPFIKLIRTAMQEGVTKTVTNIKELVEAEA
ncbi:MAG: SRPBCC family protein [Gammaproteobacteria bacterium]